MIEFNELPTQLQDDLRNWFNISDPDPADLQRLATLYTDGRFHAWDCPRCGERVTHGEPEDWDYFQGVCDQDFASYPGDKEEHVPDFLARLCDDCRSSGCMQAQATREEF